MKHARHILYLLIAAAFATGCWGWVEYFDVTADEIKVPEGISDVIPQEGTVDGKSFLFDIRNTGAGEAFKRQIAGRTVTLPVCRDTFLFISDDTEGFQKQLREKVPPCYAKAHYLHKAGDIHIDKYGLMEICLKDKETFGYDTVIGSVRPEDLKALKALYPGYHNQEPATMTLSLIN